MDGSAAPARRIAASALDGERSNRESPEPSAMRTPASGTPASAERRADDARAGRASSRASRRSLRAPSAPSRRRSCRSRAFICRTIRDSGSERSKAMVSDVGRCRPEPGAPADGDAAPLESVRERASSGGGRAVRAGEARAGDGRAPRAAATRCRGTTASSRARRGARRSACRRRRRGPRCAGSPSRRTRGRARSRSARASVGSP